MTGMQILARLFRESIKPYASRLAISLIFMIIIALTTGATAWLLDPALKKIFIEQDKVFAWSIPILIVLAFSSKGLSLYFARINIIKVNEE